MQTLLLKPREERRLAAGHLWAFSNEIDWNRSGRPEPGETRQILSANGRPLGLADVHPHTLIAARLQPVLPEARPSAQWWKELFAQRLAERRAWGLADKFHRLVNADGDLLPGLTIDLFGNTAVVAAQTAAMEARTSEIGQALLELGLTGIHFLGDTKARALEGLPTEDRWLGEPCELAWVPLGPKVVAAAPLGTGQKTGFFLDQALNRQQLAPWAAGRTVLDVCSYTGGWGLSAKAAGALEVTFADRDRNILDFVDQGWQKNGFDGAPGLLCGDAFEVMEALVADGKTFGMVVLDPPAFAKNRKTVEQALAGYQKLNRLGLALLAPGGILVTCSCSGLVPRADFRQAVVRAARQARRDIRQIADLGAAPDHPIHPAMSETSYLKVLAFAVT